MQHAKNGCVCVFGASVCVGVHGQAYELQVEERERETVSEVRNVKMW